MSEEQGGFFSQLKNQIIAGVGVALTTIGTLFLDKVKDVLGLDEEEPKTEMVQPAVEQKQEVNVTGPEIIINIPEQKPTEKVIVKEVEKKPVKKLEKEQEIDW